MVIKRRTYGDMPKNEQNASTLEELQNIDWIKEVWLNGGYKLAYSPSHNNIFDFTALMAVKDKTYFVIGYIHGDGKELGLENYINLIK